jgi:seryl-tRNA synthetase
MLDIRLIRERREFVKEELQKVGFDGAAIDNIAAIDARRRQLIQEVETLRAKRGEVSKTIAKTKGEGRDALVVEMREVGNRIGEIEKELAGVEEEFEQQMLEVPNLPDPSVPFGKDEGGNVVLRTVGTLPQFDFTPRPHWEIGPALDVLDFDRGVKISGSRFYVLKGAGARLQRALIAWMLDLHCSKHGYTEVAPPYIVKKECVYGAGQLPKFADNIYHDAEEDYWLIGTAEIPITNLHRDEILEGDTLPLSYVAFTPCFRREKMSAGRDVRGIKRGHQFDKVEMYKIVAPENSAQALEQIVNDASEVAAGLGLPYRIVDICSGDLGFVAAKKYDIEIWAAGCGEWLEVSSCSNCTTFQARRTQIRFRRQPGAKPELVHTLNGSGLALPRVLIAVIENYQQADGSVVVPEVLRPYMGGVARLEPAKRSA